MRYQFSFNRKSQLLARWQLARKVEELPNDSYLHIICNMQADYLRLYSFPTTDESAWFRKDIRYIWLSSPKHPDEWAREWEEQEKYLRKTYV